MTEERKGPPAEKKRRVDTASSVLDDVLHRVDAMVVARAAERKLSPMQKLPSAMHTDILSMLTLSERVDSYLPKGMLLIKGIKTLATKSMVLDAAFFERFMSSTEDREAVLGFWRRSGFFNTVRAISIGTRTRRAFVPPGFLGELDSMTKEMENIEIFAGIPEADVLSYVSAELPTLRVLNLDIDSEARSPGSHYDDSSARITKMLAKSKLTHLLLSNTLWEGRAEEQMLALARALPPMLVSLEIQPAMTLSENALRAMMDRCPKLVRLALTGPFSTGLTPESNWHRLPPRDWETIKLQHWGRGASLTGDELKALGGPKLRRLDCNYDTQGVDLKAVCAFLDKCPALEILNLHVDEWKYDYKEVAVAMSKTAAAASLRFFKVAYLRPSGPRQREQSDKEAFGSSTELYRLFPRLCVYPMVRPKLSFESGKTEMVRVLADPKHRNAMEYAEFGSDVLLWDTDSICAMITNSTRWKMLGVLYVIRMMDGAIDRKTMQHLVEHCPDLATCQLPAYTDISGQQLQSLLSRQIEGALAWQLGLLSQELLTLPVNTEIRLEHLRHRGSNQSVGLYGMVLAGLSIDDLIILKTESTAFTHSKIAFVVTGDVADAFVKTFGSRRTPGRSQYLDLPDSHVVFPIDADTSAVNRGEVVLTSCEHDRIYVVALGTSGARAGEDSSAFYNVKVT